MRMTPFHSGPSQSAPHKLEHTVVWDGTPNRIGGRLLFAAEPPTTVATSMTLHPSERGSVSAAIRALRPTLGAEWFTVRHVQAIVRCSIDQAYNAVNNLSRQRELEPEFKLVRRGRGRSITGQQQRYRFRGEQ